MKKIIAFVLALTTIAGVFSACSSTRSTDVQPQNFRVTTYLLCDRVEDMTDESLAHLNEITDIILFGAVTFDENGSITVDESLSKAYEKLTSYGLDESKHVYVNMLGPDCQIESDDWYEQMADKAQRHSNAFANDQLPLAIKDVLENYSLDGVFFDYEFAIKKRYWKDYNKFIVKLDEVLGDDYKIGMSLASWDAKQDAKARKATDFIEIMSYDLWDDDGNHATMDIAKKDVKAFVKKGYDKSKLDLGVPFYARPTTQDDYWYDYASYADRIDENGLYKDAETGLTFSFNTPELIKEKTDYALDEGLGGIMVWHWSCDTAYGSQESLFKSIVDAKNSRLSPM